MDQHHTTSHEHLDPDSAGVAMSDPQAAITFAERDLGERGIHALLTRDERVLYGTIARRGCGTVFGTDVSVARSLQAKLGSDHVHLSKPFLDAVEQMDAIQVWIPYSAEIWLPDECYPSGTGVETPELDDETDSQYEDWYWLERERAYYNPYKGYNEDELDEYGEPFFFETDEGWDVPYEDLDYDEFEHFLSDVHTLDYPFSSYALFNTWLSEPLRDFRQIFIPSSAPLYHLLKLAVLFAQADSPDTIKVFKIRNGRTGADIGTHVFKYDKDEAVEPPTNGEHIYYGESRFFLDPDDPPVFRDLNYIPF
jgi:hypothetical protein